jgi:hypothetical protein
MKIIPLRPCRPMSYQPYRLCILGPLADLHTKEIQYNAGNWHVMISIWEHQTPARNAEQDIAEVSLGRFKLHFGVGKQVGKDPKIWKGAGEGVPSSHEYSCPQ